MPNPDAAGDVFPPGRQHFNKGSLNEEKKLVFRSSRREPDATMVPVLAAQEQNSTASASEQKAMTILKNMSNSGLSPTLASARALPKTGIYGVVKVGTSWTLMTQGGFHLPVTLRASEHSFRSSHRISAWQKRPMNRRCKDVASRRNKNSNASTHLQIRPTTGSVRST
jgi:hypothetical protein